MGGNAEPSHAEIAGRIILIRGKRAMLDSELAGVYGIPTHRLNEAIKRNASRFRMISRLFLQLKNLES